MIKIIIGVIVAAVVVIVGFMIIDPDITTVSVNPTAEVSSNTIETGYSFTIEGEVNRPGVYTLNEESVTMADLIRSAGGVTSSADDLAFYDEAVLTKGNTYYIASKYDAIDVCTNKPIVKVNINADDLETLTTVNGITSSIASSIVSYRTSNGVFMTVEQLLDVYGIGNATYRKIRNFVTLHE